MLASERLEEVGVVHLLSLLFWAFPFKGPWKCKVCAEKLRKSSSCRNPGDSVAKKLAKPGSPVPTCQPGSDRCWIPCHVGGGGLERMPEEPFWPPVHFGPRIQPYRKYGGRNAACGLLENQARESSRALRWLSSL